MIAIRLLPCCRRLCDLAAATCGTGRTRAAASARCCWVRAHGGARPACLSLARPGPKGEALFPQPWRSLSRCDHAGSFSRSVAGDPGPLVLGGSPSSACCPWNPPLRRLRAAPSAGGRARASLPPAAGALVRWPCRAVTLLAVRNNQV